MTYDEAVETMRVAPSSDDWWWAESFCCDACFHSQGHGNEHREGCRHVALDTIISEVARLTEERDRLVKVLERMPGSTPALSWKLGQGVR